MSTLEQTKSGLETGPGTRTRAESLNERLAGFALAAFALAAPWSIAVAQIAVVLGILSLLIGFGLAARGRTQPATLPDDRSTPDRSSARNRRSPRYWDPGAPETPWPSRWPWTLRLIVVFLAVQALSILTSIDPGDSLHAFRGSWTYGFPIVFFLLLRGRRERALFGAHILVLSAALAGLYAIFQATTGTSPLDGEVLEDRGGVFMASGTLGHHLTFSGVMLPVFFLALGLAAENFPAETGRLRRVLRWTAVVAIAAGLLLCFARSGWIGLAAGLLVFAWRFGRRALASSGLVLASVASLAYLLLPAIRGRIATIGPASGPRFHLWESAWNIGVTHPWLGGGLGSWAALFPLHRVPGNYLSIAHPHNDLLNVLVETGFIGAFAWIAVWVVFFIELRPRKPIAIGIAAAVAALLLAGTLQCFITDEEVAQTWMFVLALGLTLRDADTRLPGDGSGGTGGFTGSVLR